MSVAPQLATAGFKLVYISKPDSLWIARLSLRLSWYWLSITSTVLLWQKEVTYLHSKVKGGEIHWKCLPVILSSPWRSGEDFCPFLTQSAVIKKKLGVFQWEGPCFVQLDFSNTIFSKYMAFSSFNKCLGKFCLILFLSLNKLWNP